MPLILKPDGNGKLSKRAADKAGFPIFPMNWNDPETQGLSVGFKETGFLPEALINFLVFLGWNPGTEQEIFSMDDLINEFSMERVNKAGTKFDFEKAKWFNQQYVKERDPKFLAQILIKDLNNHYSIECNENQALQIVELLKERITYPNELAEKSLVLFKPTTDYDEKVVNKKWNEETPKVLGLFVEALAGNEKIDAEGAKSLFWETLEKAGYKPGQFMQMLRVSLTGEGSGPDLMTMIEILGPTETANRIKKAIELLSK